MAEIILKGRKISGGKAEGKALVSRQPIGFLLFVDPKTGVIMQNDHDLKGESLAGRILIFPMGKGSTGGSLTIYEMARYKTAPVGIISVKADPITAIGAVISNIPMIDSLNRDPFEVINTGDYLELDGDKGTVKIKNKYLK